MGDSSDVKMLTKSGEIKPILSVVPLLPTRMHETSNNDSILAVVDEYTFELRDKSCRKIVVFGEDKKEKQSYQYNKCQQRLFTFPFRITDINSDIAVIDRTSDDGRVVVLGNEGGVKWIYQGHPQINTEDKPFNPCDIVTTSVGNVIVADCINNTLYVISGVGGPLLTYKVMLDQGVMFPWSLDIDTRGQLWIGCSAYEGESDSIQFNSIQFNSIQFNSIQSFI